MVSQEPEDQALLRNPYVLAGLAVAAAIVLAVIVVILFGSSSDSDAAVGETNVTSQNVAIDPLTPQPSRGVTARSIAPATVREGPAQEFAEIAPLRSGQDVEVIGRNQASSWFQIYYPVGSQLKGWVPSSALRLPDGSGDKLAVVIATPIPRPTIVLPSPTPEPATTATPTVTPTGTPAGGPDLALTIVGCRPNTALVVTVRNAGQVPLSNRQVRLTVASAAGILGVADSVISLEPGATLNITANQTVQPTLMMARIDLIGSPADANPGNNSVQCSGGAGQPQPGIPTVGIR
jgi:hypothetical protein